MPPNISSSDASGSEPGFRGPEGPPDDLTRREFVRSWSSRLGVASAAFSAGFGIDALWARLVRGPDLARADYPRFVVGGWRVHHSVVGYLAVLLGIFLFPGVLIPLGLGIIVGHARRDRLGFLERVDRG